jgi:hypothetical protein
MTVAATNHLEGIILLPPPAPAPARDCRMLDVVAAAINLRFGFNDSGTRWIVTRNNYYYYYYYNNNNSNNTIKKQRTHRSTNTSHRYG